MFPSLLVTPRPKIEIDANRKISGLVQEIRAGVNRPKYHHQLDMSSLSNKLWAECSADKSGK